MRLVLLALFLSLSAFAGGKAPPKPEPTPSPSVAASPAPAGQFVTLGAVGESVDQAFALKALALMNQAVSSGCLKSKVLAHKGFKSFNSVYEKSPKTAQDAYQAYVAGAPYALDLHWYYKRFGSVVGYTYNFKGDDWDKGSETRIWSNTRMMGAPKDYASHLAHELSHQARAGGFVHYTIHQGSMPYEIGDLMAECIAERRKGVGILSRSIKPTSRKEVAPY